MTTSSQVRTALISASDKTDLVPFVQQLNTLGFNILATGGSAQCLRDHGITVVDVSDYTGFPAIMDGRVKTLHPKIHGGLLARAGQDEQACQQHDIQTIDLVVVNLYPFQQTVNRDDCTLSQAIEQIDIGGPSLLRAAAKNHTRVTVVVDPKDYPQIIAEITQQGDTTLRTRQHCALKVFQHTAQYDNAIARYLHDEFLGEAASLPEQLSVTLSQVQPLRYGENPQQAAGFYRSVAENPHGFANATLIQGKPLSYNNLLDADAAWQCLQAFHYHLPTCVIVKHATPCGVAQADSALTAYQQALQTDPVSAFGGIIAFNHEIDAEIAQAVNEQFAEVVIAPAVNEAARRIFANKPNCRVLIMRDKGSSKTQWQLRSIAGGMLVQQDDFSHLVMHDCRVVTHEQPDDAIWQSLLFAWHVVRFVKSNAIVYAQKCRTLGIGSGQTSRVFSAEIAALKAKQANLSLKNTVMASDAFFPFADSVELAAKNGICAIIQPGGSKRDQEVIEAADRAGMIMVFTGVRHFRH